MGCVFFRFLIEVMSDAPMDGIIKGIIAVDGISCGRVQERPCSNILVWSDCPVAQRHFQSMLNVSVAKGV